MEGLRPIASAPMRETPTAWSSQPNGSMSIQSQPQGTGHDTGNGRGVESNVGSKGGAGRGVSLMADPRRNKGTAFTEEERNQYGLEGLLPHAVESLERQVERVMQHLDAKPSDLERYIYLIGLSDRNETLFYRTVMSDPARFIPILYDPTVADACLAFGHIYRRARGLYITREMKGRIAEVLRNWPERDVRFICVSDGGRILGLGDIGANGMGIPIGKLQLYTACAAVPPPCLLPVLLDIGTTNDALRADPLYLGLRQKPPSEVELDDLVEEFVEAVQQVFPGCCIHFEDWKGTDAIRLLNRYADKVLCYNDDIQGTASVALAGLTTALQIIDSPLTEQRILFFGAGSAAIGIARYNRLRDAVARASPRAPRAVASRCSTSTGCSSRRAPTCPKRSSVVRPQGGAFEGSRRRPSRPSSRRFSSASARRAAPSRNRSSSR